MATAMAEKRQRLQIAFDATIDPKIAELLSSHFEIVAPDQESELILSGGGAIQAKINAICDAGMELTQFDASTVRSLNVAQRLRLMEEKVILYVHDLLDMDNFEIRLLDQRTGALELVIAENLSPLKIGEVIFAKETENGICGLVASTGTSYICGDVEAEPLYKTGLDSAASSLTVPLWMNDKIIGVFNAESKTKNAFDENDRRMAEIFGRYIAGAMHTLDLLVVERYTTNEEVSKNILTELEEPLKLIADLSNKLLLSGSDVDTAKKLVAASETVEQRLKACTGGPQTILDADRAGFIQADPTLQGKRVLVADDEEAVRLGVRDVMAKLGFEVTVCVDGTETYEVLKDSKAAGTQFDLIISDIRMPGLNGYEVFHAATEFWPDQIVVLMTGFGYDPHHSIMRASQEGMHTVLFKPFRTDQLIEIVQKACRKKVGN
ncbi:MAG: response regulator [Phycisphaerae bacterium]|jgi:two-component system, sensor histidine kinase SagS|nr:response regulator [Phycisphaerae bacterium]|tara:strand:+ start:4034 stop:5341 length:1308 start_codon:yes stop_codon:yes gene_type:complete